MLLATDDAMVIDNTHTRCTFDFPHSLAGLMQEAGNTLFYHFQHEAAAGEAAYTEVRRLLPDGTELSLPFTRVTESEGVFLGFVPSPDGRLVVWGAGSRAADGVTTINNFYMADVEGRQVVTLLSDWEQADGRFAWPVRMSWDNQKLFFALTAPEGGDWNNNSGRYDALYVIAIGNSPELVFDCQVLGLVACLNDFANYGYVLAYTHGTHIVVAYRGGQIVADIATGADFAGYPLLTPNGDLLYYTAQVEQDTNGFPIPTLGRLYRLPEPYEGEPELLIETPGLLPIPRWLDEIHLVTDYTENNIWGTAVVNMVEGTVTKVEPWPQAGLVTLLPGPDAPLHTAVEFSPDGRWWVRYGSSEFVAVPEAELELYPNGFKYRIFLQVGSSDGGVTHTIVDEWRSDGLGAAHVRPLAWSQVAPALYYGNSGSVDGCAYFANGSDLYRVLLTDGSVAELLPPFKTLNLAISPDEQVVAYTAGANGRHVLAIREIALGFDGSGNPVNTAVADPVEWRIPFDLELNTTQIGNLLWSPFTQDEMVLSVVHTPCSPNERFSLLHVTLDGTVVTLIEPDVTAYSPIEWVGPETVRLLSSENETWLMDVHTAELTRE